jgi:hypothetical protein
MINDDERDYAEERANRADMRREAEQEAAHEQLRADLANVLGYLADQQQQQATRRLATIAAGVAVRAHVGDDLWSHARRQTTVAHLAGRVAAAIEQAPGYDLRGAVDAVLSVEVGRTTDDARLAAVARIVAVVQSVLDADEQRTIDAREQADRDETEAYLRRVTR